MALIENSFAGTSDQGGACGELLGGGGMELLREELARSGAIA